MNRKSGKRRGSTLLEFTLCAIPLIFVIISVVQMSLGMWYYHTLAAAVKVTTRTAATRGKSAIAAGRKLSIGAAATMLAGNAIGLSPSKLNATFYSTASGSQNCNPISSCFGNAGDWVSLSANDIGSDVIITASYRFPAPIPMWVPQYGGMQFRAVTFRAKSKQVVVF